MTIREQLEERERQTLSPMASLSAESRGRQFPAEPCPSVPNTSGTGTGSSTANPSGGSSTKLRCSSHRRGTITAPG